MGVEVLIGRVPASASTLALSSQLTLMLSLISRLPFAGIEERAKVLCALIEQHFPGREVNLIGHSMGGLDGTFQPSL